MDLIVQFYTEEIPTWHEDACLVNDLIEQGDKDSCMVAVLLRVHELCDG